MEKELTRSAKSVAAIVLSSVLLCGLDAIAEETAPPGDAGVSEEIAEPASPSAGGTEGVLPAPLTERGQRLLARHERERKLLDEAIRIEGPLPDDEKFARYRSRQQGGTALIVIGALTGVLGPVIGLFVGLGGVVADPEGGGDDGDAFITTVIVTVTCGAAMIAAGIPLTVSGMRGTKRQRLLQRKDEIIAPFDPKTATIFLSPFFDPERGTGGLRLHATF